ncbi:CPK18 [Symbiodinium natans]|uniref:CPK18 protein n=1 Tax=Symbiodinium natans TaxID=878477 RepID=A0A812L3W8_9DINO|nr:CPK18 [Symbiodinium natans]
MRHHAEYLTYAYIPEHVEGSTTLSARQVADKKLVHAHTPEGAYGTVWKGSDHKTSGVVAIKQLSKAKLSQGGKLRHNTEREVVMMRACQHENIAQLFGVFQDAKFVYLVMECCEGGDIGDRVIGSKSNVHEEQLAEWSRQMCAAVAALHGIRICRGPRGTGLSTQ